MSVAGSVRAVTTLRLTEMKQRGEKIAMLTSYDYSTAKIVDAAGVDVILVGEMRDFETISTAITAAETGHLVFSTLHTVDAASTIDRVIDVFPPHQQQQIRVQLANVLEAVIAQTLLPTINEDRRVAAFEVLHANHAVRNLIREGKTHQIPSIMQTNKAMGMQTMDDSLLELYMRRLISKDNCIKFARDPDAMMNKLM